MTRVFPRLLTVATLFVCLLPLVAHAADAVAVSYTVLSAETEGPVVIGTLRVEVRNLTSGTFQNVDVRLANPGPDSIEKGLFQFGEIPAGEARAAAGGFVFEAEPLAPILWRIDYDDEYGAHHQETLFGIQVEQ